MSHETLFFICGGILAASAVAVSVIGLKNDDFPGKWMPLIIAWFGVFAILAGTFAVLHGKEESKDHAAEYAKATEEIEKNETSGPFEKAEKEAAEAEEAEEGGGTEEPEAKVEEAANPEEENETSEKEVEQEGPAGEQLEGEAEGATTRRRQPAARRRRLLRKLLGLPRRHRPRRQRRP